MSYSRRDLGFLLMAAGAAGQKPALPSKTYRFEDLPVRDTGPTMFRAILDGQTHSGFAIELHETALAVGKAPHAPHHHANEELLLIVEETLEVTVAGTASRLGAGSVAYMASQVEHGWRNVGSIPARYFVLALGVSAA